MCAVVGYLSSDLQSGHLEKIIDIFNNSRIRGLHAFGYTVVKDDELITYKTNFFPDLISRLRLDWPFQMMIGHCRYSTSGDFFDHDNNQPLMSLDTAMVFNGVISMKTKAEMEKEFALTMTCENDGDIALQYFDIKQTKFTDFIRKNRGSFAGLFLSKKHGNFNLYAYRNDSRPLWLHLHERTVFVASTKDIFKRSSIENAQALDSNNLTGWGLF